MQNNTKAPKTQTILVHAQHRNLCLEAYGDFLSAVQDISPIQSRRAPKFCSAHEWYTDGLVFAVTETLPFAMRRAKRHTRNVEHLVLFSRLVEGSTKGTYDDEAINRRPGPIYVSDQAKTFEAITGCNVLQSVLVPKATLGFHPDKLPIPREIHRTCMAGNLVHSGMDNLFASLWRNDDHVSAPALDQFIACLKIAMGAPPQRGDVRAHARDALFNLICDHIEKNLGDVDLCTTSLLRDFGVSRTSLYRMFEDGGGVRSYITERRALRAMLEISKAPDKRGQIRIAAERWGFLTPPTFNRTVQRLYGASPGKLFCSSPQTEGRGAGQLFSHFAARTATIC